MGGIRESEELELFVVHLTSNWKLDESWEVHDRMGKLRL